MTTWTVVQLGCDSTVLLSCIDWIARRDVQSSCYRSPLEVYAFVVVGERGEHVMSDEICCRCNGKQQGRRRGVRIVQLPDSFMVLHPSLRHSCTYTYVLYVRPNIFSGKKSEKTPSEVRFPDGHVLVSINSGYISDRNGVHINFWCGKHVYLRETFYRVWHAWSTCSPLVQKKTKIIPGTDVFLTETRGDYFWTFWWPAVGGNTFCPLAPILGPV